MEKTKINTEINTDLENNINPFLLNFKCSHHKYYMYNEIYECEEIGSKICKMIDNKQNIDNDIIMRYFFNCISPDLFINHTDCYNINAENLSHYFEKIFEYMTIDELPASFSKLIYKKEYDNCFITIITQNPNIKFSLPFADKLANRFNYDNDYNILIDIILNNLIEPEKIINDLKLSERNVYYNKNIAKLISETDIKYELKLINLALENIPATNCILDEIIKKGYELNLDTLDIACRCTNIESMKYILNRIKLTPRESNFKELIVRRPYNSEVYDKMELLFYFGYKPSIEDIKLCIDYKIDIPKLDRFNTVYDKELLDYGIENGYIIKAKYKDIDDKQIEMYKLFNEQNLQNIKKFLKKTSMKPDLNCFKLASKKKYNTNIIKLLIKSDAPIDLTCIVNIIKNLKYNQTLLDLINLYDKQTNKQT